VTRSSGALSPRASDRPIVVYSGLFALVLGLFSLQLMMGPVSVPFGDVWTVLTGGSAERPTWDTIVRDLRLPRVLTSIVVGAGLGASGLQMQTLFRNPLADPWILGVVAGSRLGVALLLVGGGTWVARGGEIPLLDSLGLAGAGVIGATAALLALGVAARRVSALTLLILGLMFDFFARGLLSVLLHFTGEAQVAVFRAWDDGTFAGVGWQQWPVLAVAITTGLLATISLLRSLNGLLLGESYAATMGVPVVRVRGFVLASTALMAGTATAFCGPIAFLGVAVPHIARGIMKSADHRVLLPAVLPLGAALAQSADLLTNLPWDRHWLHLNTVNFLIGAPVVVWVVLRGRGLGAAPS
jgi:iron complex transport system permease protein